MTAIVFSSIKVLDEEWEVVMTAEVVDLSTYRTKHQYVYRAVVELAGLDGKMITIPALGWKFPPYFAPEDWNKKQIQSEMEVPLSAHLRALKEGSEEIPEDTVDLSGYYSTAYIIEITVHI